MSRRARPPDDRWRAAVAETAPVLLVRYRPGVVKETMRTVHVVALPSDGQADALTAGCGAILIPRDLEIVAPGEGMPCTSCVLHCVMDATAIEEPPGNGADPAESVPTGTTYQEWGWPVTQERDQLHLNLDHAVSAVMIPTPHCGEVIPILAQRRCLPPVLAHPYAPEHHIVLTGEQYGMQLPWPEEVHQITGTLLLPPTPTPRGPVSWIISPHRDSLRLCREIDLFTALRASGAAKPWT